jgi:alpha-tubulin suppressor-like RCC1 family protein
MSAPTLIEGISGVSEAAAGAEHTCVVADSSVTCWGRTLGVENIYGLLTLDVLGEAVALAAGNDHSCALLEDTTVACWGSNELRKLGYDGDLDEHTEPVKANLLGDDIAEVDVGDAHTCVRKMDGSVWCIGASDVGALGLGELDETPISRQVAELGRDAVDISTGMDSTCAVTADGALWCWGAGGIAPGGAQRTPIRVTGIDGVRKVAAGLRHTCALTEAGVVWCFGSNAEGQLGNNSEEDSDTPVAADLPCP